MNHKPKIAPLPRWLINIGLTLQFYIPGLIYLCLVLMLLVFAGPVEAGVRGRGLAMVIGMVSLVILLVAVCWCGIYLHWHRHGDPCNALIFLITTNILACGIWLSYWIGEFPKGNMGYIVQSRVAALLLMRPESP